MRIENISPAKNPGEIVEWDLADARFGGKVLIFIIPIPRT
jgi:hypothetical protein